MSQDNAKGVKGIERGFREGLIRIDLKLSPPDTNTPHSTSLIGDLYRSFGDTDVYEEAPLLPFKEFEQARANWSNGRGLWKNPLRSHFYHDKMLAMAGVYFEVAVLTLESFVPPEYDGVPVKKYFGALSHVMKVGRFPAIHRPSTCCQYLHS